MAIPHTLAYAARILGEDVDLLEAIPTTMIISISATSSRSGPIRRKP